jgi:hypothetical protein
MPSPRRSGSNWVGHFAAGLVGGLIVLLAGYGFLAGGFGRDTAGEAAVASRFDTVQQALQAVSTRVSTLETRPAPADTGPRIDALDNKLSALETAQNGATERLDKVESAIAALPPPAPPVPQSLAATSKFLDELIQRVDALESTASSADVPVILGDRITKLETATAVLSGRLDAVADQMQALAARPESATDSEKAARAVAIGTLRQAAGRGGSFTADLAMVAALVDDSADLNELRPLAATGAPSTATLAAEFPNIANAILAASGPGENAGIFERLIARARGLVSIRPVGPIAGDSPAAVVSRMQAAVDKGDLAAALAERLALPAAEQAASASWAGAAADRVAIDQLVEKLVIALGAPPKAD